MEEYKKCRYCGKRFVPHPAVPFQKYCSEPTCQKARKRAWQKEKLANDKDYKENQKRSQKRWFSENRGYWRSYRNRKPQYTRQNRVQQKKRNREKRISRIAKMDELTHECDCIRGDYKLIPLYKKKIAKMDELIVRIKPISRVSADDQQPSP
ncbi:MAG: hypothetical protein HQM08_21415 [Candidatus Riflebacteria bacterium]|nr:hypothetical protein [Candidatus Riflebacteria bacterium]